MARSVGGSLWKLLRRPLIPPRRLTDGSPIAESIYSSRFLQAGWTTEYIIAACTVHTPSPMSPGLPASQMQNVKRQADENSHGGRNRSESHKDIEKTYFVCMPIHTQALGSAVRSISICPVDLPKHKTQTAPSTPDAQALLLGGPTYEPFHFSFRQKGGLLKRQGQRQGSKRHFPLRILS